MADARGWTHTICTPYAKWAHGVAEKNNQVMRDIMRHLCRDLNVEINQWPKLTKLVQGAMNRHRRKSRGDMSPIKLTTGINPRTAASVLHRGGKTIEVMDEAATLSVNLAARLMAERMEKIYDMANLARRAHSRQNWERTAREAIPNIDVGYFVLYAKHEPDTKLDYTWLGPAVVTEIVTTQVM